MIVIAVDQKSFSGRITMGAPSDILSVPGCSPNRLFLALQGDPDPAPLQKNLEELTAKNWWYRWRGFVHRPHDPFLRTG